MLETNIGDSIDYNSDKWKTLLASVSRYHERGTIHNLFQTMPNPNPKLLSFPQYITCIFLELNNDDHVDSVKKLGIYVKHIIYIEKLIVPVTNYILFYNNGAVDLCDDM